MDEHWNECDTCGGSFPLVFGYDTCEACKQYIPSSFQCVGCYKQVKCSIEDGWSHCIQCNVTLCEGCRWCQACLASRHKSAKEIRKEKIAEKKTQRKQAMAATK
jgi:hypothetical protein